MNIYDNRHPGRLPAEARNLKSFHDAGYRSMDAIAAWVSQGLVCGPLERHELPAEIRVSPAGEADKPNGRARYDNNYSHKQSHVSPG